MTREGVTSSPIVIIWSAGALAGAVIDWPACEAKPLLLMC